MGHVGPEGHQGALGQHGEEGQLSTNYYLLGHNDGGDDPAYHVGKRNAAGLYCHEHRFSLCNEGETMVHQANNTWRDECPNPNCDGYKIAGACSWTWAMEPWMALERMNVHKDEPAFEDEYGEILTGVEMRAVVESCEIKFKDSIGVYFS